MGQSLGKKFAASVLLVYKSLLPIDNFSPSFFNIDGYSKENDCGGDTVDAVEGIALAVRRVGARAAS